MSARYERVDAEAFGDVHEAAGLPLLRIAGAVCCAVPGVESFLLNRAIALGLERTPSDAELDEIDAFFHAAGVRYAVPIPPGCAPDLEPRLRERGFADGYAWMKFSRGVETAPACETSLEIEETKDAAAFARVVTTAFDLPPDVAGNFATVAGRPRWHLFLARDEGEAVGAGALFLDEGAGWLGVGGTMPSHRGKGAHSALLAARIERAQELGADILVTETGERVEGRPSNSYRNILRAGFAEAYLQPNLHAPQ